MTGTHKKIRGLLLAALMVSSVFVGAIALSGTAAAQSRTTVFQGQVANISDSSLSDGETVTVVDSDDGTVADQVTADNNSVEIDTKDLPTGLYELENGSGAVFAELRVSEQTLNASFADDNVETGDNTTLDLDSNRADYTVNVSASGLDNSEIEAIFAGANATEVDGNVQINVSSEQFTADFSNVDKSDYTFDFEVTDTTAMSNASISVGDVADTDAQFNQSVYEGTRGDVAEMTVELTETETAQVQIGSDAVNYNTTVDLTDGDNDGEVVIEFNTHATAYNGTENYTSAFSAADDEDSVTVSGNETNLSEVLAATDYDLSASVSGDEKDVATLVINEGSVDSFEISTMPAASFDEASSDNVSEVEEMTTDRTDVASGDVVVHRLEGSGLFGAVQTYGDFDSVLNNTNSSVVIEESDAGPNADPQSVNVSDLTEGDDYNVYTDSEAGVVYITVDSDAIGFAETGEEYTASLTLSDDVVTEQTELNATFDLVERSVEFDTQEIDDEDTVVVRAEENATVSGESSVAPGTEGTVRVKSTGDSPFLLSEDIEIQDDGTFAADFDFEGVNSDSEFTATVELEQGTSSKVDGVVQPAKEASVNIESQNVTAGDDQTVTVKAARLSHGGFITIHDSSLTDGATFESVRGTSDYIETSGADEVVRNIEITLDEPYTEDGTAIAMPHQDTNDNEQYDFVTSDGEDDGPYTENGEAVVDSADLTVEEGGADATASVTIDDQTSDGSTVTVASASLPEGGFVTIHDSSLNDGATLESVRGTSDYLESGDASDIEITLDEPYTEDGTAIAMPHQDTNDNEQYDFVTSDGEDDGPYTDADGNIVLDDASLTVGDEGGETTDEGTDSGTDEGTETPTQTVDDSDETETTEADGPGFGIVAALIALVAAALVAVRRD